MKPFVVLDNWHIDQPPTRFELALSNSQLPVKVYKTNRGEFPDTLEASGVFVGPSVSGAYDQEPWIAREQDVLRAFAAKNIPMLGLCFGSQLLASAMASAGEGAARTPALSCSHSASSKSGCLGSSKISRSTTLSTAPSARSRSRLGSPRKTRPTT